MSELVVYEPQPLNAAMLARMSNLKLREVRSLTQLRQTTQSVQATVVCVEVRLTELADVVAIVRPIKQTKPGPSVIIGMPEAAVRPHVMPLYEAGVDLLLWSALDCKRASRLIQRALRASTSVPELNTPIRDRVWSRLPWKRHASGGSRTPEKRNNGVTG